MIENTKTGKVYHVSEEVFEKSKDLSQIVVRHFKR